MKRLPARVLLPLVLIATFLVLGAGPIVNDGPANLRATPGGEVLTTVETGTEIAVTDATCVDSIGWWGVTASGQSGWIAAELVDLVEGVAASSPEDGQLELRAEPFGVVTTLVPAGQAMTVTGIACTEGTIWLEVSTGGTIGWVLGDFVAFQPGTPAPQQTPTVGETPQPAATSAPTVAPTSTTASQAGHTHYVSASPEYGIGVFVWGRPDAVDSLNRVRDLEFNWQKSLIRWRDIEPNAKGQYEWSGSDALVQQSNAAGLKIVARLDFQPTWARQDGANNGPPDNYQDFADFVFALVDRYKTGSPHGRLHAVEIWNEVNLAREWGEKPINQDQAREYVRLLGLAYEAAKRADPAVTVVTAGLSPTGWNDDTARPDDVYLQWLYDAGMKGKYDALGAHGPGFKAPPEVSPDEAAANPTYGGHRSFTFRRIEDLRGIMERNGDADKQVWVLEFGWTSDEVNAAYAWHRVSEQEKADYLVRAFQWAGQHWAPWIGVMTVWNMPDSAWGPQDEMYWWGITNPDGSPRPAYTALQNARRDGTLP